MFCTCGQFLIDSESRRKFRKLRLDALSIQNNVLKKGRSHGARHGKTEEQKGYLVAWNVWKRRCKKVDSQGEQFTGIRDRFLRDPVYLESQLAIGWTEMQRVGRNCKRRSYTSSKSRGKEKIPTTMVSHLEQIRQKWAFEASIRFTPPVRRTSCRAYFSRTIQYMAFLFKHIVVEHDLEMSS